MNKQIDVLIRPACAADLTAITACVHQAYQHYVDRIGRTPQPMLEDYAQVIAHRQTFAAELNDRVVGVLVLAANKDGFLLENVAVHPEYQGKGVGRLMLEFAESEARRIGSRTICLYTHEKMFESQALYTKAGYVEYDRRTENGYARIYMRKALQ